MAKRTLDLFGDPPWVEAPVGVTTRPLSPRVSLAVASASAAVVVASVLMPWYASSETAPMTPLSHWLALGRGPGSQTWGALILGLAVFVTCLSAHASRSPTKRTAVGLAFAICSLLVVAIVLEVTTHPSVNPGPSLSSDWGALLGVLAAFFTQVCLVVAVFPLRVDKVLAMKKYLS